MFTPPLSKKSAGVGGGGELDLQDVIKNHLLTFQGSYKHLSTAGTSQKQRSLFHSDRGRDVLLKEERLDSGLRRIVGIHKSGIAETFP